MVAEPTGFRSPYMSGGSQQPFLKVCNHMMIWQCSFKPPEGLNGNIVAKLVANYILVEGITASNQRTEVEEQTGALSHSRNSLSPVAGRAVVGHCQTHVGNQSVGHHLRP